MKITYQEIIKAFDTPTQLKIDTLRKENIAHERAVLRNVKLINRLNQKLNKEQDVIANKLDRKNPDWRKILVRGVKN